MTIFHELYGKIARRTDRFFGYLMIFQWLFGILCAVVISPRSWMGSQSQVHLHIWAAVLLGGLLTLFPAVLAFWRPGKVSTRHVIALGQVLFSALLIHLMAGRIETHFHVFGSLAFLAFYRDFRVLITASVVVTLDHFLRGVYWPQSVYGIAAVENWRWLEHFGWVVFEDIFLILSCIVGVQDLRAISERRASLEESNIEIEQLRKEAEEANQAKSAFLANMSHEIRTPLGAVLGFSQLLCEPGVDQDSKKSYLEVIDRNGEALTRLIDDIIDLAKVDAGKLGVESVEFSLSDLLRDISASLAGKARGKGLEFLLDCQPGLPDTIISDPTRIRQILLNIIGNAIKFTEKGFVQISVSGTLTASNIELHFKISDSGRGLSMEEQSKIFEPFSQGNISTARKFGGNGLGLALSRKLARKLGGTLVLEHSLPGQGSTFIATIVGGFKSPADETPGVAGQVKGPHLPKKKLSGVRVLVAEDTRDNQLLIERYLARAGAEVNIVENGADAMRKALADKFDVVLMDIQMPVMDGYCATEKLRQSGYNKAIIALTAHAMVEDRAKCMAAGFNEYLAKPIDADVLIRTIETLAKNAVLEH